MDGKKFLGNFTSYDCTFGHLELSFDKLPEKHSQRAESSFVPCPKIMEQRYYFSEKIPSSQIVPLDTSIAVLTKVVKKNQRETRNFFLTMSKSLDRTILLSKKNDSSQSVPINTGRTALKWLPNKHCQKSIKIDPKCSKKPKKTFMIFFQISYTSKVVYGHVECSFDNHLQKNLTDGENFFVPCPKIIKKDNFPNKKIDSSQSVSMDTQIALLTIFLKTISTDGRHFFCTTNKNLEKRPSDENWDSSRTLPKNM